MSRVRPWFDALSTLAGAVLALAACAGAPASPPGTTAPGQSVFASASGLTPTSAGGSEATADATSLLRPTQPPRGPILFVRGDRLFTANPDGSNLADVGERAAIEYGGPQWLPDGRILVDTKIEGLWQLLIVDPEAGTQHTITSGPVNHVSPAVSPDGQTIALDEFTGDLDDGLHLIDLDGSHDRRLTSPAPGVLSDDQPSFSPDGRQIAFVRTVGSPDAATSIVYVIGLDGVRLRRVTSSDLDMGHPQWSPDGRRLLVTDHHGTDLRNGDRVSLNLWTVLPDGSSLKPITHETMGHFAMDGAWSPDGQSVVYRSWHGGDDFLAIRTMSLDGTASSIVERADFGAGDLEAPTWRWGS